MSERRDRLANPLKCADRAVAHRVQPSRQSEVAMKHAIKKLQLNKQTLRVVGFDELAQAAGGWIRPPISWSCPQPSGGCGKIED
jgi:hypothetical protein